MNALENKIEAKFSNVRISDSLSSLLLSEFATKSTPAIDTKVLEAVSCDSCFLIEICKSFLHCAPEKIEAIKAAIADENAVALRESAYALRSLSACVGASSLLQFCRSMESIGASDRFCLADSMLKHITLEYEKVKIAIQDYQHSLPISS